MLQQRLPDDCVPVPSKKKPTNGARPPGEAQQAHVEAVRPTYTFAEVMEASLAYFGGDELAANVFATKYALKNNANQYVEKTPEDMHRRLAREFARAEAKYPNSLSEEEIFDLFDHFRYVVPQGSPMSAIGNPYRYQSASNCYVVPPPYDSYGGIFVTDQQQAQIMKRRGGVGFDISTLRPKGQPTTNAAETTDGIGVFMERYSRTCKEVAQCLAAGTLVLTSKGLKPIERIQQRSDLVWTAEGWRRVAKVLKNRKSVVQVRTSRGLEVWASGDHVFHSMSGEIAVGEMMVGDPITNLLGEGWEGSAIPLEPPFMGMSGNRLKRWRFPSTLTAELAYLVGQFCGDGCVEVAEKKITTNHCVSVALSNDWPEVTEKVTTLVERVFGYSGRLKPGDGDLQRLRISSEQIYLFLTVNGLFQREPEVAFPQCFLRAKREVLAAFVAGYFDADGYASGSKKGYSFSSTSRRFLTTLKIVLAAYGIATSWHEEDRSEKGWKTLYSANVVGASSQRRFIEFLGGQSVKVASLGFVAKRDNVLSIFNAADLGVRYSKFAYCPDPSHLLSRNTLDRLAVEGVDIPSCAMRMSNDEIVQVVEGGEEETYDLVLDDTHLFFANGLYAHNSGRRGALMITCDVHHPEIMTFVRIKNEKTACRACGHEERTKVTHANISVRLSDEFLKAVEEGKEYHLRWPCDEKENPKIEGWLDAREVWAEIMKGARDSAEPGLLFWDTILRESPADCYAEEGYRTVSTNPCMTGDTLVAVADGRGFVSFETLADEGCDVPVYACGEEGRIVIKMMRNPGISGRKPVYKIKLEDGTIFRATKEHQFLLRAGVYASVDELMVGDSLHVGYRYEASIKDRWPKRDKRGQDYLWLRNCNRSYSRAEHRMIWEFATGKEIPKHHRLPLKRSLDRRIAYAKSVTDLPLVVEGREILVRKTCPQCGKNFSLPLTRRGQECCSSACQNSRRARLEGFRKKHLQGVRTGHRKRMRCVRDEQLRVFTAVQFRLGRVPYRREWERSCSEEGVPFNIRKSNVNGFRSYAALKEAAQNYNHRIVSIEEDGTADVYNGAVDGVSNYYIGGVESLSKYGKPQRVLINSHNCAEIPLSANADSCRLLALNLTSFVSDPFTDQAAFEWEKFRQVANKAQRLLDDLVDIELELVEKILAKIDKDPEPDWVKAPERMLWEETHKAGLTGRRTGLGITGLGDTVAMLGVRYGTDESIEVVREIYKALAVGSYEASVEMAGERGCFPIYNYAKEKDHPFIQRIMEAGGPELRMRWEQNGRRNIANLTTAPTGSVSMMTQTTSGIEPLYKALYTRSKKINPNDQGARVDRVDNEGVAWQDYTVSEHGFRKWKEVTGKTDDDFEESPYHMAEAESMDWQQRVRLQAAAGQYVDHAISSTLNLPETVTVEEVEKIYTEAWKAGCKGITIYREGSREDAPIKKKSAFVQHNAPKRLEKLACDIHRSRVKIGEKEYTDWMILVGLYDGKPYEIFGGFSENIEIPKKITQGVIVKRSFKDGGKYDLWYGDEDDPNKIKNIVKMFDNPQQGDFTRILSLSLRHGAPVQFIAEQLGRTADADMYDFAKVIARVLKKYIADGTEVKAVKVCPDCGGKGTMVYQENCPRCRQCGSTKCG